MADKTTAMNEVPDTPKMRPTTQAAEGVPRLRWTLEEFERLGELGIFTEDDHIELIGGELVPMSPKGNRHEAVRGAILNWLRRHLPPEFDLHAEPGWRAAGREYFEPDFLIGPARCSPTSVAPSDVALIIEVAHSSLRFDTNTKARRYAAIGVREYWVVNAQTLDARIHRDPAPEGYRGAAEVMPAEPLTAQFVPGLSLRLSDLSIA
ncbi:MAG TPA: Uma2 family endonuclease [Hyphomicrobiaceae bacterium]|nr:Uma2 family endonuclease [Hyphomicrobiaceae bacterium]